MTRQILVVDDHPVVRHGVRCILEESKEFVVGAEADSAAAAIREVERKAFDAVLLDISLPDRNGIEVLRDIRARFPRLPVLILSVHDEDFYAVRAVQAGASGYLNKRSVSAELIAALTNVCAGRQYITPTVAQQLACALRGEPLAPLHRRLSLREFEVFRLLACGQSVKRIAAQLHLSPKTVSTYRARILEKTGLKDNEEIIRYALHEGLTN